MILPVLGSFGVPNARLVRKPPAPRREALDSDSQGVDPRIADQDLRVHLRYQDPEAGFTTVMILRRHIPSNSIGGEKKVDLPTGCLHRLRYRSRPVITQKLSGAPLREKEMGLAHLEATIEHSR